MQDLGGIQGQGDYERRDKGHRKTQKKGILEMRREGNGKNPCSREFHRNVTHDTEKESPLLIWLVRKTACRML